LDTGMAIGRSVQISSIKQQQINVAQKWCIQRHISHSVQKRKIKKIVE
jgi:hypothetical protein